MNTNDSRLDLDRSAISRYIQLATLFRRRIESGEWAIGQQIPTVDTLAMDCGVARATIRQALGILETEGLIERFRAKGTFVLRRPQDHVWYNVETDWPGLLSSSPKGAIEVLAMETGATPRYRPHAIGDLSKSYRYFKRRHWQDDVPFLITDVYLDQKLSQKIPPEAYTSKTALRIAASLPGVTIIDARQTLTVGAADMETAEQLKIALNAPVVHISRSAVDQRGTLVLVTNGIYRGDVIRVDFKLQ